MSVWMWVARAAQAQDSSAARKLLPQGPRGYLPRLRPRRVRGPAAIVTRRCAPWHIPQNQEGRFDSYMLGGGRRGRGMGLSPHPRYGGGCLPAAVAREAEERTRQFSDFGVCRAGGSRGCSRPRASHAHTSRGPGRLWGRPCPVPLRREQPVGALRVSRDTVPRAPSMAASRSCPLPPPPFPKGA